ncbi:MAG: DUF2312 domain-containing protein [Nitrospirae bacterium]|nr:DUF2312 domain-containing protein [Magnetococcales bacterium]HAT50239.1 hypothetical protein [Alphaproteobacteria bacterium]
MALQSISNHGITTPNTPPPTVRKMDRYVDRIERARQAAQEAARNHVDSILSEAQADGFDQDIIRLLARERRMASALDKFLARRHVS